MKQNYKLLGLLIFVATSYNAMSQGLINNGAQLIVNPQADVIIDGLSGNYTNQNSGVTNIYGCLQLNGNYTNNATLTVKSYAAGDGNLVISGSRSGSGTDNVERYLSGSQWHLVTSPITTGTAGVFNAIWLRPYDESTNNFGAYIVAPSSPMPSGQGFSVWANAAETRTFSGFVNNENIGPIALQRTNEGWNLIGNPYPCTIDWNSASGWTKTNVGATIYVWDQSQYATWNGVTGTNGGNRYIAMEQGFFVQAVSAGASISMNNDVKVRQGVPFLKYDENPELISLKVSGNGYSDEHIIWLNENTTESFDFDRDAEKLYGISDAPQLYTLKNEKMTAIHTISEIEYLYEKELYLETGANTNYLLEYQHSIYSENPPLIMDKQTQQIISPNSTYSFSSSPDDPANRFVFLYDATELGDEDELQSLQVWEYDNILHILPAETDQIISVEIFTISGALVMTANSQQTDLNSLSPAIYVAKVNTELNTVVEKVIVK